MLIYSAGTKSEVKLDPKIRLDETSLCSKRINSNYFKEIMRLKYCEEIYF